MNSGLLRRDSEVGISSEIPVLIFIKFPMIFLMVFKSEHLCNCGRIVKTAPILHVFYLYYLAGKSIFLLFAGNEWSSKEHAFRVVLHRIPELGTGHLAVSV